MAKKESLVGVFACFLIMVAGCQKEKEANLKDPEKLKPEKPEMAAEEVSANFPPLGTSEVRAFSLPPGVSKFLEDGKLNPEIDRSQGVVLGGELLEEAYVALNSPIHHEMNFMCWEPRDALIFFDDEGEMVGSVVICFTCYKTKTSPSGLSKNMDYGLLARVFAHPDLKGGYPFEKKGVGFYDSEYHEDLAKGFERLAKSRGRTLILEPWVLAEPLDEVKIQPGDEVYVSSSLRLDSCCGRVKVGLRGLVKPKCCKRSVNVGGMTEVEASKIVKELFVREEIYYPSTKVKQG